jgi:hypothetical protein
MLEVKTRSGQRKSADATTIALFALPPIEHGSHSTIFRAGLGLGEPDTIDE